MLLFAVLTIAASMPELERARDQQDRAALERLSSELTKAAESRSNDPVAQYRAALALSYTAEVAMEVRDKNAAKIAAERGIKTAERAVALKPTESEYHRILGTLCGQIIPAHLMSGLRYGRCAQEAINKAVELNPKSAMAYLSRAIGNYYLPSMLGGGVETGINDCRKAIQLDASLAEGYLWLGIMLRKANQPVEARKALMKSIELNPKRVWAKQQLEKTPK
jgi:tetratricopeptide (TPR) repeat protein